MTPIITLYLFIYFTYISIDIIIYVFEGTSWPSKIFWMVDRVITDPSLDLLSPYEVVPWVLIPVAYLLGAHNTHKWWWSTLMHDGERVLQSTRMAMPTTISMRSWHLRSSAMAMWQERWRGRSKGILTLGGGGGREHHEVVGIVRVWGREARMRSTGSIWLRDEEAMGEEGDCVPCWRDWFDCSGERGVSTFIEPDLIAAVPHYGLDQTKF
jgi:hypothetical protein